MTVGTATTAMMPSYTFAFAVSGIAAVVVFVLWILFMKDGESGQKVSGVTPGKSESSIKKQEYLAGGTLSNVCAGM